MLALAGGVDSAMMMAGSLHPPFSLFLSAEKEKTGRARSKREKDAFGGCGRFLLQLKGAQEI